MNIPAAIELGQEALIWIAGEPEILAGFLAATGAGAADVAAGAGDPAFLGGLLDHLLENDSRVVAFAAAAGVAPEIVIRARAALPGGDAPEWP